MTRSSTLALVTLFAGLLSLASVASVSAGPSCSEPVYRHCDAGAVAAADDPLLSAATIATYPVHILASNGRGQEHFEAMVAAPITLFSVASPTQYLSFPATAWGRSISRR